MTSNKQMQIYADVVPKLLHVLFETSTESTRMDFFSLPFLGHASRLRHLVLQARAPGWLLVE
jgi:hypothetical protein